MTYQNFVHARATQPKEHIKKYIKQAAMLSISLAAFCSYGSCGDGPEDVDIYSPIHRAPIHRVGIPDNTSIISEADVEIPYKDSMRSKIEAALRVLTNPAVLNAQFGSNIKQGFYLVNLAIQSLNKERDHLDSMEHLLESADSTNASASMRAMLDAEYQAHLSAIDNHAYISWNGVPLFTGGSGDNTRLGTKTAALTGATTTNINAGLELTGFIVGSVDSVNVDTSGLVNIVVGGQHFQGTFPLGTIGKVRLTSATDVANKITLDVTGTGFTTTDKIQEELEKLFQLDIASPISIRSSSTDLSTTLTRIETGAATLPGIYGLSYGYNSTAGTVTYKVSNGLHAWEKSYDAFKSINANLGKNARTVVFNNGLTITTAANHDERDPAVGVEIINVETGNQVVMDIHTGELTTDKIELVFPRANTLSLNLQGTNLLNLDSRAMAKSNIDGARIKLNSILASLNDHKSQLLDKLTELCQSPLTKEEMALPHAETTFDIAELDQYMESIIPNAQQKLDDIIADTTAYSEPENPITNAFSTVAFSASMRTLIAEQLQLMKKIGTYADADTISLDQHQKLDEAFQRHKNSINLIANGSWNDVSSVADRSMDVQVDRHSVSITLWNLTVEALGLTDLNISDKYSTIEACNKIDEKIIQISHGIAALGGQMSRLRCATQIASATDNTNYLTFMAQQIRTAQVRAIQSASDTISPSQRTMLNTELTAIKDCTNMLETTYDEVGDEPVYSLALLRGDGDLSFYKQLSDASISDKHSARLIIERLTAVSDQYRAQLKKLLAGLSDDSNSADTQATDISHEKID